MMARISFLIILILTLLTTSCVKNRAHLLDEDIKRARPTFGYIVALLGEVKMGAGSGVLVSHDITSSYILTAGHVCEGAGPLKLKIIDYVGGQYSAIIVKKKFTPTTDKIDLCLLKTNKRMPYAPIKVSEHDLQWGEKVWELHAGAGDFYPRNTENPHGLLQVDEGRFSGYDEWMNRYVFKGLGVLPGSSGSMVLNHRGHLVSMITSFRMHRAIGEANEISYGQPLSQIRKFLKGYIR